MQVEEFGAINMTGLRMVQYGTPLARDFFPRWCNTIATQLSPSSRLSSHNLALTCLPRYTQFTLDQAKRTRSSKASQEQKSISAGGALAFDTVNLLINTFSSLIRKERSMFKVERKGKGMREPVRCGDLSDGEKPRAWELGPRILQEIKNTSFVGLTGDWGSIITPHSQAR